MKTPNGSLITLAFGSIAFSLWVQNFFAGVFMWCIGMFVLYTIEWVGGARR